MRADFQGARLLLRYLLVSLPIIALVACGRSGIGDELLDQLQDDGGIDGATLDGDILKDAGKDGSRTGDGGPCTTSQDCNDDNACTQDFCANGRCSNPIRDQDNDGYSDSLCGGLDCNDHDPRIHPGAAEICDDRVDNDCNGLADCADPSCRFDRVCADGGRPDGGHDGGPDSGPDSGHDGGPDSGPDSGPDTGPDSGPDSGVDACVPIEDCTNGIDDNCDGLIDCADPQCSSTAQCACERTPENCSNGQDDNCNGLVDCADPGCYASPACNCTGRPPQPEICTDHIDNDCNGKTDCADPACFANPACAHCTQEVCNNGVDDDCNGLIDCADPACAFASSCRPVAEICDNGIDDDHNGLTDCEDPACATNPGCVLKHEFCASPLVITGSGTWTGNTTGFINRNTGSCGGAAGEAVFELELSQPSKVEIDTRGSQFDSLLYVRQGACKGGRELACDDDSGGNHNALINFTILYPGKYFIFVDGFTVDPQRGPDQGPYVLNVNITENPPEICDNGVDDDGNHLVDCADPACTNVGKCLNCNNGQPPTPELGVGRCTDGRDNDCDGKVDCADSDCHASTYYTTECCNGRDDNGNGIIDEDACRCADDSTCSNGNFCFTHTAYTCNLPCTFIVGDICPYIQPQTSCSSSTRQCEY